MMEHHSACRPQGLPKKGSHGFITTHDCAQETLGGAMTRLRLIANSSLGAEHGMGDGRGWRQTVFDRQQTLPS